LPRILNHFPTDQERVRTRSEPAVVTQRAAITDLLPFREHPETVVMLALQRKHFDKRIRSKITGWGEGAVKRLLKDLSGCDATSYLRFSLVRNEEAGGSNPLSSTDSKRLNPFQVVQLAGREGRNPFRSSRPIPDATHAAAATSYSVPTRVFWHVRTKCAVALAELRLSPLRRKMLSPPCSSSSFFRMGCRLYLRMFRCEICDPSSSQNTRPLRRLPTNSCSIAANVAGRSTTRPCLESAFFVFM